MFVSAPPPTNFDEILMKYCLEGGKPPDEFFSSFIWFSSGPDEFFILFLLGVLAENETHLKTHLAQMSFFIWKLIWRFFVFPAWF